VERLGVSEVTTVVTSLTPQIEAQAVMMTVVCYRCTRHYNCSTKTQEKIVKGRFIRHTNVKVWALWAVTAPASARRADEGRMLAI
jgi:hypothetical protein